MFRIILCFVCLLATFQFSACPRVIKIFPSDNFTKEARSKYEATSAELEHNRRLWQESKIENYDFKIAYNTMVGCTCAPAAVKVREGKMVSIEKIPKDFPDEIFPYKNYETGQIETIDRVFDLIKQTLDDDLIVETKYDEKLGYPQTILITHSFNVDSKTFFFITDFEIIK